MPAGELSRDDRQFHGTGNAHHDRLGHPARSGRRDRPIHQLIGDLGVPAGGRDGEAEPGRVDDLAVRAPCSAHRTPAAVAAGPELTSPATGRLSIWCPRRSRLAVR